VLAPVDPGVLRDRIRGMMLGAAIGDALGSAFEFVSSAAIYRTYGPVVKEYHRGVAGSLLSGRSPGIPTDDTAMALSLARVIAEGSGTSAQSIADRFASDLSQDGTFGKMFLTGGPGNACLSMLYAFKRGAQPFEGIDPNAGGNGAAMRAHPCGVLPSIGEAIALAALQARLSHPHPAAVASAQAIAAVAHVALYEGRLLAVLPGAISDERMRSAWEYFHDIDTKVHLAGGALPARLRDVDMAGWNTVSAAHAIASLFAEDLAAAVGAAAASGLDTDTVAGMVGAMLGAVHGTRALPGHLLDGLSYREEIERIANALADAALRLGNRSIL
jgi:ADP-ribosylglycohydrolase